MGTIFVVGIRDDGMMLEGITVMKRIVWRYENNMDAD